MTDILSRRRPLVKCLLEEEGLRLIPYRCTAGFWTVGIGHRLEMSPQGVIHNWPGKPSIGELTTGGGNPVSLGDVVQVFAADLGEVEAYIEKVYPKNISIVRIEALMDMAFQLGAHGLSKFRETNHLIGLAADQRMSWEEVAREALDSKWARSDTPKRARAVTERLRTGQY